MVPKGCSNLSMKPLLLLIAGALLGAEPTLAQPNTQPANGLPYPLVSPEEAVRLSGGLKPLALHLRNVTVKEGIEEIERQTGVPINSQSDYLQRSGYGNKRLSLDLNTFSFWEATDALFNAAGLGLRLRLEKDAAQAEWTVNGVLPENETPSGLPAFKRGAFAWRVPHLEGWYRTEVIPGRKRHVFLEQGLQVLLESRVDARLLVMGEPGIKVIRADDERGRILELPRVGNVWDSSGSNFIYHRIDFVPFEEKRKRLAHLEGTGRFIIGFHFRHFELPTTSANTTNQFVVEGNSTPVVVSVKTTPPFNRSDKRLRIRVQVESVSALNDPDHPEATNPLLSRQFMRFMRLCDAQGRLPKGASLSSSNAKNGFLFDYYLQEPSPDGSSSTGALKLVFDLPTEFVQTEVPFSFSDLPLP